MTTEHFLVPGMQHNHAAQQITAVLQAIAGVMHVQVDIQQHHISVVHNGTIRLATLIDTIRHLGYHDVAVLA